ncbi:MAG: nucleoside deaminase [Deltaproteobacteria bacterium]|nr:nucleoside deaminase [Deltaproteobacteria bacterium]
MSLAIEVSRRNVTEKTGGPFGSAIFDRATGEVLAVGMNLVVLSHNSTLHAEMVAFQMAEARLGTHSLGDPRRTELFTSCEPCAMCLGATLWSGVSRLVTAAKGDDARAIGFDEGPVFAESYRYLAARGVEIVHDLGRTEAQRVLELYRSSGGLIYNGVPAD